MFSIYHNLWWNARNYLLSVITTTVAFDSSGSDILVCVVLLQLPRKEKYPAYIPLRPDPHQCKPAPPPTSTTTTTTITPPSSPPTAPSSKPGNTGMQGSKLFIVPYPFHSQRKYVQLLLTPKPDMGVEDKVKLTRKSNKKIKTDSGNSQMFPNVCTIETSNSN